jgi:hypothetical protein
MAAMKDTSALTTYYNKLWKAKYGSDPNTNGWTARWGFDHLLNSVGTVARAKEVLDYYFTTASGSRHDLEKFFYNYEKVIKSMLDTEKDKAHRDKVMEETRIRVEEWRAKRGNNRTTDS